MHCRKRWKKTKTKRKTSRRRPKRVIRRLSTSWPSSKCSALCNCGSIIERNAWGGWSRENRRKRKTLSISCRISPIARPASKRRPTTWRRVGINSVAAMKQNERLNQKRQTPGAPAVSKTWHCAIVACACASYFLAAGARAEPDGGPPPRSDAPAIGASVLVAAPSAEQVRTRVLDWVAQRGISDRGRLEEIGRLWALKDEPPTAQTLFDLAIETFARSDETTQKFVDACQLQHAPLLPPEAKLLEQAGLGR